MRWTRSVRSSLFWQSPQAGWQGRAGPESEAVNVDDDAVVDADEMSGMPERLRS